MKVRIYNVIATLILLNIYMIVKSGQRIKNKKHSFGRYEISKNNTNTPVIKNERGTEFRLNIYLVSNKI